MASVGRGTLVQHIDRLYTDGTLLGLADGQLLERYLTRGDESAFEALVSLHGPMVLGLCRRALRDPRDVEDAFQATFLILIRKAPTIRNGNLLSNWLYGVADRVARRARANTLRRRDREMGVPNLDAPATPSMTATAGIGPELDQELNRLPRKYRAPLVLCYLQGHTHDQAAERLECPVGTVRSRLARGRDLLRRRLASRGYTPTAAFLREATALHANLLTEAVPPSLISATVEAAVGMGASKTLSTCAATASVRALTQGVLTTMKLAQLKMITLAVLAAGMSAGGIVAVSYGAGQALKPVAARESSSATVAETQESANPTSLDGVVNRQTTVEGRLDGLERKLDELLSRSTMPMGIASSTSSVSKNPTPLVPARNLENESPRKEFNSARSVKELEVELGLAEANEGRIQQLHQRAVVSTSELEQARGKVALIRAALEGLDDELGDELDRLKLETKRKKAEVDQALAQRTAALTVVDRNHRLNERKAGLVDELSVARAEAEAMVAESQLAVKKVQLEEVELRITQFERRRGRVKRTIAISYRQADRRQMEVPAAPNGAAGAPTAP